MRNFNLKMCSHYSNTAHVPLSMYRLCFCPWFSYSQIQICSSSSNFEGCCKQEAGIWISSKKPKVTAKFDSLQMFFITLSSQWRIYKMWFYAFQMGHDNNDKKISVQLSPSSSNDTRYLLPLGRTYTWISRSDVSQMVARIYS